MNNRLKLNKKLYDAVDIEKAKEEFEKLCEIRISENDGYFVCEFFKCKYNLDATMLEFENYVIDLMNSVRISYDY